MNFEACVDGNARLVVRVAAEIGGHRVAADAESGQAKRGAAADV